MVHWRTTAARVRNTVSSRHDPHSSSRPHTPHSFPYPSRPLTPHTFPHSSRSQTPLDLPHSPSSSRPHTPHNLHNSPSRPHTPSHNLPHHQHNDSNEPRSEIIHSYTTAPSSHSHLHTSIPSMDAASTGSSVSRVPDAFYIPNSIAQRASLNMPPADAAALRRQLAFDALALVRDLPCVAEGWMLVKRDGPKLSSFFRSQWIPFWGELRGGMLLFCNPQSDYAHHNKRQIKLVFTATNCIIDIKNTSSYSQVKLRRPDAQSLIIRVANSQEAQQWCVALQSYTFQYTTIRLADFDWITAIGKGASGKVFLVRDNRTNARLALKVIDKSRVFRTLLTFQHVVNERLVLEMCSGCPFIIQLRYAFQTDSHLYFATDFYDGGDVFSLLQSHRGRLSEHHARRIIAEIVLALSWLHERNIVYRDLKPENVVLDGEGHVRLADFGLAKVLKSQHHYLTQTICGTTAYAAPEMLQSNPYNVSLDLWCLGVFIYHVLSGKTPFNFRGRTMEEMEEMQRTRQVRYNSSLSLEAVSLIKGLLQNDPFRRSSLEDVKRHPFFRGVDWARVAQKEPHPDDISRFVCDKEKRGTTVARLAVARAQQLGVESESAAALARTDLQEISSMTLDRYLLRNVNPEEWRHVSFSDDDDMSATGEFPAFVHKKGAEKETWAIAGWGWTCSEASGHDSRLREGRNGLIGMAENAGGSMRASMSSGRRSLPVWNVHNRDSSQGRSLINDIARQFPGHRNSLQEQPTSYLPHGVVSQRASRTIYNQRSSLEEQQISYMSPELQNERASRPIDDGGPRRFEFVNALDEGGRHSLDMSLDGLGRRTGGENYRASSQDHGSSRRTRGMLNFGKFGNTVREARSRASLENFPRLRKHVERTSRDGRFRRNDEGVSLPSPPDMRQAKSSLEFNLRRVEHE